jgi:hypothetical protein
MTVSCCHLQHLTHLIFEGHSHHLKNSVLEYSNTLGITIHEQILQIIFCWCSPESRRTTYFRQVNAEPIKRHGVPGDGVQKVSVFSSSKPQSTLFIPPDLIMIPKQCAPMTSNSPKTMRAVGFKRFGAAAKNLEAIEVPKPTITNPYDIIVQVKATALNPSDGIRPTGYTRLIETVK